MSHMDEHKINDWYWWPFFFKKEKDSNIKKKAIVLIYYCVYCLSIWDTLYLRSMQVLGRQFRAIGASTGKRNIEALHQQKPPFLQCIVLCPIKSTLYFFLHSIRKSRDIYQSLYSKHMGKKIHPTLKSLTSTINLCNFLSQLRSLKKLSKSTFLVKVSVRKINIPQQTPIQVSQKYQIATFETFGNDKCTNIYIMYIFCNVYIYGKQKYV